MTEQSVQFNSSPYSEATPLVSGGTGYGVDPQRTFNPVRVVCNVKENFKSILGPGGEAGGRFAVIDFLRFICTLGIIASSLGYENLTLYVPNLYDGLSFSVRWLFNLSITSWDMLFVISGFLACAFSFIRFRI